MRAEDRAEIEAVGLVVRHTLVTLYRRTPQPRVALIDGQVAAVWGDAAPLLADTGVVWMFTADPVERLPLAFFREAKAEIAGYLTYRRSLRTQVACCYGRALRFLRMLGFDLGDTVLNGKYREITIKQRDSSLASLMKRPFFVIYALPRSRTAWLSRFLSYGDWQCLHEQAILLRDVHDMKQLLACPRLGVAETAAGPGWRLLKHYAPNHQAIVIRRPVGETVAAMIEAGRKAGVSYDEAQLRRIMTYSDRCLAQISAEPGTLTVPYDALDNEETCRRIFEACLPYPFDRGWWQECRERNIQVDLTAFYQRYHAARGQVEDFKRECRRELSRLVRAGEIVRALH